MRQNRVKKGPAPPIVWFVHGRSWSTALHLLLLSGLTLALYARGVGNGFVTDDEREVLRDPLIRSFTNIPRFFAHNVWYFAGIKVENYYRPLKLTAYALEYQLFGFRAAGWHLAAILFQIGAVIAVYLVVRDLTSQRLGLWTGLWFALHPIHVEPVAWVAGGQDVLCFMALMFSLWAYHRGRSASSSGLPYAVSAALFFLGLLLKEAALPFPAVILAYDFLYRQASPNEMLRGWRRYTGFVAALSVYTALRMHALGGFAPYSGVVLTPKETALSVPMLALKNLWATLFPVQLNYWRMYAPVRAIGWQPLAAMAVLMVLIAAVFWLRRKQPVVAFAMAWFWLTLLPALDISKISSPLAERYLYIPSFGICLLAAWGTLGVNDRTSRPFARRVAFAAIAGIFAGCAAVIVHRLPDWHDTLSLVEKTAQQSPNSASAVGTLGYEYFGRGRLEDARRYYTRALELDPSIWPLWVNLGATYNSLREWRQAVDACQNGLRMSPDNPILLNQIALALWQEGQREQGMDAWRRSVRIDPTNLGAHVNLATGLYQLGQVDAAVKELQKALSAEPDSEDAYLAHFKLGYIYEQRGASQDAVREYRRTLEMKPDFAPAREQMEGIQARLKNSQL